MQDMQDVFRKTAQGRGGLRVDQQARDRCAEGCRDLAGAM